MKEEKILLIGGPADGATIEDNGAKFVDIPAGREKIEFSLDDNVDVNCGFIEIQKYKREVISTAISRHYFYIPVEMRIDQALDLLLYKYGASQ